MIKFLWLGSNIVLGVMAKVRESMHECLDFWPKNPITYTKLDGLTWKVDNEVK